METCVGAHHLSRKLASLGHDARLMPAKYVRPYSKGPKNDFNDAEAIAEAVQRPTMKFVATKTAEQLDLQALHRVRERLVSQRTGIINQIRPSCWNAGSPCARGSASCVRNCLPSCDTHRCPVATHVTCHRGVGRRLAPAGSAHRWPIRRDRGTGPSRSGMFAPNDGAWHRANHFERHGGRDRHWRLYSPKAATSAPGPDWCPNRSRRETARSSAKSRGAAIALPARSVCAGGMGCAGQGKELGTLRAQILDRSRQEALHHNVLAIALANKLARIAWAVLAKGRAFELARTDDAGVRPA